MLGCNFSVLTMIKILMLLGVGILVTAIQLRLNKMITDGIPGFSLSVEPEEKDVMKHAPTPAGKNIFADGFLG